MTRKIFFIHPIFHINGGAEKVIFDLMYSLKDIYEIHLVTLFNTKLLKDIKNVHFATEKSPLFHHILGFKSNPFINKYIKEISLKVKNMISKDDIIILSNFPASLIYKNIQKGNAIFLCFEPDRILYYNKSIKHRFLPKKLISLKYRFASLLINHWKKTDYDTIRNKSKIITLSEFVNNQVKIIYKKNSNKIFEHYTKDLLKSDKTKIKIINNHFKLKLSNKDKIFLSLGRLEEGKGLIKMIDNFKKLKCDNLQLLIGGAGQLKKTIVNKTKNVANIHYLGFIPNRLLSKVFSISDIFIFLGEKETGGPLTVIEAMGHGLIVLVPNDGGAAYEIIQDGINGIITDQNNIYESLNKIVNLSQSEIESLKDNAYKWVKKYGTKEKAMRDFKNFLKNYTSSL